MFGIRRREFITLLGGAAAAWPLAARAQQGERGRRIGVLMNFAADDAEGQVRLATFLQGLQETGWAIGRNVRIDLRWGAANNELYRKYAAELVALAPDVILASATPSVQALQHANRTVPVVFAMVGDPVGMGVVASLARPGGNTTGFTPMEFGFSAKWVELLKEIAPRVTRVAVLRDLTIGPAQLSAIQAKNSASGSLLPWLVRTICVGRGEMGARGPKPARCHRTRVSGRTIVMALRTDGNHRYSWMKNKRSLFVSWTRPRTFRRNMIS
jgi:putative tryptophan/tyrosine transport system substrate-binding protein